MEDGDYDAEGAFGDDGADYAAPPDDDGEDLGGGELVLSAVKQRFQADLNVLIAAISARVVPDKVDLPKVRQEAPACMDQLLTKWKARQSTTVNVTLRYRDREAASARVDSDDAFVQGRRGFKRAFGAIRGDE